MSKTTKITILFLSLWFLRLSDPVSGQIVGEIATLAAENLAGNMAEIFATNNCCGDAGCYYWMYDILFHEAWHHHRELLDREGTIPRISSLEIFINGAYNPSEYYLFLPGLRVNRGFFSTDFRVFSIYEQALNYSDGYNTISYLTYDWQVLQLNLVVLPEFNLRAGTGFMLEQFTGLAYNEHTVNADIFFEKRSAFLVPSIFTTEFRFASDYVTGAVPRMEFSAIGNYKLQNTGRLNVYLSLGGMYALYYSTVNVWALQAGLNMRIE
ncbi:MAG: hypothetical protein FVQ77_17180 [Cytophagales bacterium]|nr:hypothetical protein [Cytophagales bacterium]